MKSVGLEPERWRLRTALDSHALEEWTDILSRTHVQFDVCSTRRTPSTFYGAVTRQRFGDLALVDCGCSPFLGRSRSTMYASSRPAAIFGLQFVRRGVEQIRERSRELSLRAGDVVLWDGLMPVEIEVVEPFVKRTVIFPRERVLAVCPRLDDVRTLPPLAGNASVRLLVRYLDSLALELGSLDEPGRVAAADAALELLRAAVAPNVPSSRAARRAAMCGEVRRYIRDHLQDASLGPDSIAVAHAMSVRALHSLFEDSDDSICGLIRHERLARCRSDLELANGDSVTEIAFRWGFHDAAHFARVFKAHYDQTPSDVRREALARRAETAQLVAAT
ncbi:MAG TPA: helix-turn-helix domain-containing protein [Solirubrobacteraceae bacterium]|nr:helix-turn-helix domain-containing protein [Solirubrobacteraceae bacterium]